MTDDWIKTTPEEVGMVVLSAVVTYAAILVYTRLTGLRSFSKMSAADFAMTVAVGSLFASTVSLAKPTWLVRLLALEILFSGQWLLAYLRKVSSKFSKLVDNEPLLLMRGETILHDNLSQANVTMADLRGKLREANVLNYSQVVAVVFETTGDISVLHSSDPNAKLEPALLEDVLAADRIPAEQLKT